jgi:nitroreductase
VSDLNQVLEVIKKRRSWRVYDAKPVPRKLIQAVIDAGNEAPSGMNSQPWRFIVVVSGAMRKRLFDAAYPKWRKVYEDLMKNPASAEEAAKYGRMEDPVYYKAPAVVFVIGKGAINCALCCENMMLAAESLGLGSCYVYFGSLIMDDPEIVKVLELEEKDEIFGPILLGYPVGEPEVPPKKTARVKWV